MKIVHLHLDKKFISESERFISSEFDNVTLYIGERESSLFKYNFDVVTLDKSEKSIRAISNHFKGVDLVIFYSLTDFYYKLIKHIPQKTKLGWRFFGSELYNDLKKDLLTKKTKEVNSSLNFNVKKKSFFKKILNINSFFNNKIRIRNRRLTLNRIDIFFGLYEEEFKFLKKHFDLPDCFVRLNIPMNYYPETFYSGNKNKIIIGNSRNKWNNHLDIIDIFKSMKSNKYQLIIPFNYGEISEYSKAVESRISLLPNTFLLKEFLSSSEYITLFKEVAALIVNSKRQMAVGNILIAIKNGVKIYLNKENSYYTYLINQNFKISTIEDLPSDYRQRNIELSLEDRNHNFKALQNLIMNYQASDFQKKIIDIIRYD